MKERTKGVVEVFLNDFWHSAVFGFRYSSSTILKDRLKFAMIKVYDIVVYGST